MSVYKVEAMSTLTIKCISTSKHQLGYQDICTVVQCRITCSSKEKLSGLEFKYSNREASERNESSLKITHLLV